MPHMSYATSENTPLVARSSSSRRPWIFVAITAVLLVTAVVLGVLYQRASDDADSYKMSAAQAANTHALCSAVPVPTLPDPVALGFHTETRKRLGTALRGRLPGLRALVLMQGAATTEHFLADTEMLVWQESNFFYLSGYGKGGLARLLCVLGRETDVVAWDVECTLFVKKPSLPADVIWDGFAPTLEFLNTTYDVDNVRWTEDLEAVAEAAKSYTNVTQLHTLPDFPHADSLIVPVALQTLTRNTTQLRAGLGAARAVKTHLELQMIKHASDVGVAAHKFVMKETQRSQHEYQIEANFVALNTLCGIKQQAYLPIVGSGPRSAILHYNTNKMPVTGNWVLIDAGGVFYGYTTDITRTWPVDGLYSDDQRAIYNVVLASADAAIDIFRDGMPWENVTDASRLAMLKGLLDLGLVNGTIDELIANSIHGVFQPHSLGHHVGLDVHDYAPGGLGQCRSSEDPDEPIVCPGQLEANMTITVEPGIYFIPELINISLADPKKAPFLVESRIRHFVDKDFGGVRIEDVVQVGPEKGIMLSAAIPRTADKVSAWIRQ
eukprot:m.37052 g.37052  ORF g.37052 m.37052 type:complete len:551 (-) comp11071_c0_seq2:212-1864(-)